jgi:hypothetical protein
MTSAAKANRNADIVDRLEAENARLQTALGYHVNELQEARRQAIRDATEIERLRAAVDLALEAFRQIDRKSAEYLLALNAPKQPGAT